MVLLFRPALVLFSLLLSQYASASPLDRFSRARRFLLNFRGGSSGDENHDPYGGFSENPYYPPPAEGHQHDAPYDMNNGPVESSEVPNSGLPPPDLPPDLPDLPYGSAQEQQQPDPYQGSYQTTPHQQHPHQQHQPVHPYGVPPQQLQQQHAQGHPPPPLPNGGIPNQPFPQQQQGMQQPQPDEGSSWDDTTKNSDSGGDRGMDLSGFDKEYILRGLARLYRKKILPLELSSRYGHFHSPPLSPSDFDAPPMILLLGQYSVGKTSFIKYLLGRDFPGIRIGPEPTTDRFTTVLLGNQDKVIPGAALCSQTHRPFTGLSPFGNNFLSRFEGAELDAPILRNVTLVDTPGILSGQKQRSRNYDYEAVMKWFAERADLIIIMFDAHKLDISDELKRVMQLMIPHSDKIRIVLNKADSISTQQLMRVYGALMWQLGKVLNTPEVARVYMGSFWDGPYQNTDQSELLQREEMDLLHDIIALPQQAVMRRINEMVKRARSVKVHAYIIHYLRKQLPYTWGKRDKQKRLIGRLESEFMAAARRYGLPKGDFPNVEPMRQALNEIKDLSEFPKLDKRLVREMDKVFSVEIPDLLEKARHER
uniref:Dynamin-type G domain-containing protein n=1 Tax=Entomoneis paludosa TaxID=265537 RepID=A0A7S2VC54_9STRA